MRHVPNALTISRIVLTPVLLVLVASGSLMGRSWGFALFVIAAISDYLDGSLARRFSVHSRLGNFLDPFADKVLVLGTFSILAWKMPDVVPWWAVVVIAARDFVVTGVRSRAESKGLSLRTLRVAKMKTVAQLVLLIVLLLIRVAERVPGTIGEWAAALLGTPAPYLLTLGVVAFTVYTGLVYLLRPQYLAPARQND